MEKIPWMYDCAYVEQFIMFTPQVPAEMINFELTFDTAAIRSLFADNFDHNLCFKDGMWNRFQMCGRRR